MEPETKNGSCEGCCGKKKWRKAHTCGSGGLYCLGFIGAAIYYIQGAPTFWAGVIGVLKAAVWPAFLAYQAFWFLGM